MSSVGFHLMEGHRVDVEAVPSRRDASFRARACVLTYAYLAAVACNANQLVVEERGTSCYWRGYSSHTMVNAPRGILQMPPLYKLEAGIGFQKGPSLRHLNLAGAHRGIERAVYSPFEGAPQWFRRLQARSYCRTVNVESLDGANHPAVATRHAAGARAGEAWVGNVLLHAPIDSLLVRSVSLRSDTNLFAGPPNDHRYASPLMQRMLETQERDQDQEDQHACDEGGIYFCSGVARRCRS